MKIDNESTSTVQDETMADASSTAATAAAASTVSNAALALPPNRFELELEFVQSLASPAYLHYLATSGILYQSSFLDFLRYLRYWKRPEYAKYLIYPNCLYFLDLLVPPDDHHRDDDDDERKHDGQTDDSATEKASEVKRADRGEAFRREIAQVQFRNFVHEQQFYSWQFRSARLYGTGGASKEAKDEESHPESST